jgi:hypothetical protein
MHISIYDSVLVCLQLGYEEILQSSYVIYFRNLYSKYLAFSG